LEAIRMAKGVHGRQGPPPDPNALRREHDNGEWVTLPSEGRVGDAPDWPLADQTERERELWDNEWRRPQAIMWERNGQELEVAMYCRCFALAEQMNATVAARTLIRQQQEALGISLPGMARNRWKIEAEPTVAKGKARRRSTASSRDRFKVVAGGRA
jgi:hypothetical protein